MGGVAPAASPFFCLLFHGIDYSNAAITYGGKHFSRLVLNCKIYVVICQAGIGDQLIVSGISSAQRQKKVDMAYSQIFWRY
jgi:hypothetical protein